MKTFPDFVFDFIVEFMFIVWAAIAVGFMIALSYSVIMQIRNDN